MITGKNFIVDDLRGNPISPVVGPITIHPTKPVAPISKTDPIRIGEPLKPYKPGAAPPTVNTSGTGGIPLALLSIQAVQTPVKEQSQTACLVTVNFTHATDPNFDHVNIWIEHYHGSPTPLLVASSSQSPLSFVLDSTQETITVLGQTASSGGLTAALQFALSTNVKLSGIVSAPPAPTISQSVVGTSTGFQFAFNQVSLPANDAEVIACYKVYRSSSNAFNTASLIQTIVPTPALTGAITVTDLIMAATGVSYYYWVTATNTAGFESTATAAQGGTAAIGSVGSTPFSITSNFTYTSTTSSITWSWSAFVIYRADGSTTNVSGSSQLITGLSASTTYFFFPYWDDVAQAVGWVAGGVGSPAFAQTAVTLSLIQQMNYRNRIPLSVGGMSAATPGSGSGGGSGGGGGGGGGGRQFY